MPHLMTGGENPWLPRRRAGSSGLSLFTFPFAGGGGAVFHGLAQRLRGTARAIDVVPVLLPGRERRLQEPPFRSMGALLERLERDMSAELEQPHALLGYSLGALLAFELARRRQAARRPGSVHLPVHLFVAACRAPHALAERKPIHALPDEAFLAHVKALGGIPEEVLQHPELVRLVLPALRADFEIYNTYRFEPGPKLDCPITALGGEDDLEVPRVDLEAWQEVCNGQFAAHWLPGGHFFLQREEERVSAIVSAKLDSAAEAQL